MESYKLNDVIKNTAQKKNLDEDLMRSVADYIFSKTKKQMSLFPTLSIYLQGLMIFFYGYSRLQKFKKRVDEGKEVGFLKNHSPEEKQEVMEKIDTLLEVYPVYIAERKQVKTKYKEDKKASIENGIDKEV